MSRQLMCSVWCSPNGKEKTPSIRAKIYCFGDSGYRVIFEHLPRRVFSPGYSAEFEITTSISASYEDAKALVKSVCDQFYPLHGTIEFTELV